MREDQQGVAAVEFAIWSALFFTVALGGLDVADMYLKRSQVGEAVSAASLQSFSQRDNVNFANLPGYVRALTQNEGTSVSLQCNGVAGSCTNFNRTCACLQQDGSFASAVCGAPCTGSGQTGGSTAGYYLTITASDGFAPVLLPKSSVGNTVSQSVTVRLQ